MFLRKLILSVTLMLALILTAGASGSAQAQGGTPTPTLPPAPEICSADQKVIADVEAGATVSFWTLSLSPTFDSYLADVFARFEKTYGVKVNWTDVPFGEAQTRYRNALAAGNAPDVINLSGGWVPEFAEAGQILSMDQNVPEAVRKDYFEGAYTGYNVNGESYQVPWYLSIQFMMVNKQILTDAGLSEKDIPKNFEELAKVSRTVKEKTKRYGFAPNRRRYLPQAAGGRRRADPQGWQGRIQYAGRRGCPAILRRSGEGRRDPEGHHYA
jgi:putative chitobiose transport system substrate-binding protein